MTPKEKAEELVNKFIQTNGNAFFAKECALIAVDEILKSTPHCPSKPLDIMPHFSADKYWKQVKQEIEKL